MEKEITLKELNDLNNKYGDLGVEVETECGFKKINNVGITEENSNILRLELVNGMYLEGSPEHKVKKQNNEFVKLSELNGNEKIKTIDGISEIECIESLDFKEDLYDIEVDEIHEYYSNGIVSHNSTFCLDAIKFLLFGTTTKTDKNEQIFNDYSDNNKLSVKGEVDLDAELLFIERKMSKSVSNSGNVNINNKLDLYKKDVDGKYHKLNEEDAKQTQQKISDFIGKEKDFESVVIANDKTLENLIDSTPTENGKLLNRFIGTEVFFEKEKKAREEYNAFAKNMLSNTYDVVNLKEEINDHQEKINKCNGLLEEKNKQLDGVKKELDNNNNRKDELFSQKRPIDESIQNVDKDKLEREIQKIEKDGKELGDKKKGVDDKLKELGDIEFDEDRFNELSASIAEKEQEIRSNNNEQERLQKLVDDLEQGQICPTCKRPLEDVDHSNEIDKNKEEIKRLEESNKNINEGLKLLNEEYSELSKTKEKVDEKNKLELEQSRLKAEIDSLRTEYKEKDALRERFKENSENITKNKNIQSEIDKVKSQIEIKEGEKDQLNKNIESLKNEIDTHKENIDHKNSLIDKIQKEKEVERLYKVYIEMLGKKGVRKIVLQSVLPTINSELNKLLDEVCNFSINLDINHKDEVQFYINKDGSERLLKSASGLERVGSSLALRCVLGRVSNLPTPNFVVFDEIFGKVGESNMSRMKDLLDKVTDMYDIVFFITHSSLVKDWADNIISITSDGKISRLDLNKEQ